MLEYTDLPREAATAAEGGGQAMPGWPASSSLQFSQVGGYE